MSASTTPYISHLPLSTVVTRKGQITIPAPIRKRLGIKQGDSMTFQVEGKEVKLKPAHSTLTEGYQSIPALKKPLTWKEMERIAHEDHVEEIMKEYR